jgi:MFS family permease
LALHTAAKAPFLFFFGLGAFFMSWYHGPLTATIHDLVPPSGHATALGLYYLFVNLFAMALAPLIIGRAADRYGLITALHIPIASQLIGGVFFTIVVLLIRRHGLHHPVLQQHWEGAGVLPLATAELEA